MSQAIANANLKPTDVNYINAHGTSTAMNDKAETDAIKGVFGNDANKVAISSTKSLTGHALGAAGVHEAIYSLLMMENKFICLSANIDELDPPDGDMPIVRERQDNVELACVLTNSFGFGGTNASLAFKRLAA